MNLRIVAVVSSILLGMLLMGIALAVMLFRDNPHPGLLLIVRAYLACGVAFISAGFFGTIKIDGKWKDLGVVATGGFGAFALVWMVTPPLLEAVQSLMTVQN